ncbi:hypothetical protein [Thermococcus sp. Bubb.Bath]|nr:hypothetical protein [Thermococcus sp. Bubb.Bath]
MHADSRGHPTQEILWDAIRVKDFNEAPKLPPALSQERVDYLEV